MAFANPHITSAAIEATEFMDLTRRFRVTGVPKTIVNDTIEIMGALPEDMFVRAALQTCPTRPGRHANSRAETHGLSTPPAPSIIFPNGRRRENARRARRPSMVRALVTAIVCAAMSAAPAAQQGKKVYISVDLEGISGVNADDQTSAGQPEYGRARKLMAEDANAAIRGAFEGGATDVLVNDSHGSQRNLLPEDLDPRARLITHSFKRHGMMEGLDETFDAVIFVGYHAKADAPRGLFAHTGSGVVRDLQINGRSVGEGGMNALLAAWYGVPVVVVSGDDVAVAEVKESVPAIRGVVVKRAINVRAAELKPLQAARREIQEAARDGVAGREANGAAASGTVQGADALSQLHLSRSRDRVSRDRTRRAGHRRIHPRHDARSVSPDPRALSIHQSRLNAFGDDAAERAPCAIAGQDAIDDLEVAARQQPVGRLAALGLGRPPVGDQRIVRSASPRSAESCRHCRTTCRDTDRFPARGSRRALRSGAAPSGC